VRYERNDIYTFTGRILVALNPFQSLPIYGDAMMKRFSAKSDGKEAEPHVYAIGELAYARMRRTGGSQAVVMSGESGAGKTETTKHLMRYLTQRASRASELEAISTVILQANPITEAFGNAKTQRNNNSSRFGKFIKIHFGQHGAVTGASLTTYLLERSRVTQMASDERSYHIFYQARRHPRATRAPAAAAAAAAAASLPLPHPLTPAPPRAQLVAGADKTTKKEFKLDGKGAKDFASLSGGGATAIDGVDDKATYQETAGALGLAGLDAEETHALMKLLAGVLHAGTIAFDADADGNGVVAKKAEAAGSAAKELLGVPKLMHYLTERLITAGSGSMFTKQLTPAECGRARDALVRTVYARAFDWLVGRINTFVGGKHDADELAKQHYVGLLDIFGFERFAHNGFEQLCINYANEKLQQLFLGCVFKAEAEIHRAEGVPWKLIDFSDNQARRGAATPSTHPSPPTPARPPPPALPSPSPSPVRPPPRRGAST
jgi:myosin heavy subunit